MTLYEFIKMDEQEQAETIWDAVHIADRDDGIHKILLYQINGKESFYVEAYYHIEHNVLKFRPFKSLDLLDRRYGNQIDVVRR
jgi:hypothetical protein